MSEEGRSSDAAKFQSVKNAIDIRTVHGGVHLHEEKREVLTPHMLPPAILHFTNRVDRLRLLNEARSRAAEAGVPLLVLCVGPSGIGKSELVTTWLWQIRTEFPGPHLFADMGDGGPKPAKDVLGRFLRLLGVAPADVPVDSEEMAGMFRSRLHQQPSIVFLDDVTLASQVQPFLSNAAGSVTVVTARRPPREFPGAVVVPVAAMDDEAIWELLQRVAGIEVTAGEERDLLVRMFAGSPLPACSAAMQLALGRSLSQYAREVAEEQNRVSGGEMGEHGSVTAVLNTGYQRLDADAARLYRCLGSLFGRHFTDEMAAAAAGIDDATAWLGQIAAAGLVEDLGEGRYRLHALALEHARGLAAEGEREEALQRTVRWYLRTVVRADYALMPKRWRLGGEYRAYQGTEPSLPKREASAWLEAEMDALGAAVRAASERGWHGLVVQLVEAQWTLCFLGKHYDHWVAIHRSGIESAAGGVDRRFLGRMHCQLGFAYFELGRLDEAAREFEAAGDADRAAGHVRGQVTAIESQGLVNLARSGAESLPGLRTTDQGAAEEALRLLTENLSLNMTMAEEADDERAVALAWRNRGRALSAVGDHEAAIGHSVRAAELLEALPDPYNAGKTYADLGQAYLRSGWMSEAGPVLERALGLLSEERAPAEQAKVLETLSVLAERTGEVGAAAEWLTKALAILEAHHSRRAGTVRSRLEGLTG